MLKSKQMETKIGREDDKEEVSFKVADRRKFNPDGSVRECVVLDAPKPEPKAAPPETPVANDQPADLGSGEQDAIPDTGQDEDDIPGADDPASFVNFLST